MSFIGEWTLKIVVCFAMEYYFTVKQNEPLIEKTLANLNNRLKKPDIKEYTSIYMNIATSKTVLEKKTVLWRARVSRRERVKSDE